MVFQKKCICFGVNNSNYIVNNVLLLAKFYIFRCKIQNDIPNINAILNLMKYTEKIEAIVARNKNKYNLHLKKWDKLL